MVILVIQNGNIQTHISQYIPDCHVVKSQETDIKNIDIDMYNAIIILGGHQHISDIDKLPYLQDVAELIKQCLYSNKKVIGICLGCQLIAYVLGCTVAKLSYMEVGYDTDILDCKLFRCHSDYVIPNDKITVLETFNGMPYIFVSGSLIGIQCHPDIPPELIPKFSGIDCHNSVNYENINNDNKKIIDYLFNIKTNV